MQLFQPGALTATSKKGTKNKVRDVASGPFTEGTRLSSGSDHDIEGQRSKVLPEALLQHGQQHAFISLPKLKKDAFFILFLLPVPMHVCTPYCRLYTSLGCARDHALVPPSFVHLGPAPAPR